MPSPRVDAAWAEPHFFHHITPVFQALPSELRGEVFGPGLIPPSTNPVLVASYGDYKRARAAGREVLMMEHGNGQTFRNPDGSLLKHASYAGADRPGVILFICPGPSAAGAYREAGATPVVEVGCPKLDKWIGKRPPKAARPVVAISFHWDCKVCPETRSAWPEYLSIPNNAYLQALARTHTVLGHGHPRVYRSLIGMYRSIGVEPVESFDEVLARADLYATDGSSTLYEFAATSRPVVVLNSRHYRRDARHGLRFWDAAHVGLHCDHPSQLAQVVENALREPPGVPQARSDALTHAYSHLDGRSSQRAADAIVEVLRGRA